jgi:hypothetical protein
MALGSLQHGTDLLVRKLSVRDIPKLEAIHNREGLDYPFPNFDNRLYAVQKVVEIDDKLIGAAFAHITSEVSLIFDGSLSKLTRARAIKLLVEEMYRNLPSLGLEDTHVFVIPENDEQYAEFLIQNFGFVRASGIPLYKQF